MRIVEYSEIEEEFVDALRQNSILPIIGSGFTAKCACNRGTVPSGSMMRTDMIHALSKEIGDQYIDELKKQTFSRIAYYYNKKINIKDRKQYLQHNFLNVQINDNRRGFLDIPWKYIYTLNLDDGIENNSSYKTTILPNRDFDEDILESEKCVIKIHGDARDFCTYADGEEFSILDSEQYARSIRTNPNILARLSRDFSSENILFLGCSLEDEVDLQSIFSDSPDSALVIHHRYYVTSENIDVFKKIDLEGLGIDTVVKVNNYDLFYQDFIAYFHKAQQLPTENIDRFSRISFRWAKRDDRDINKKHLYCASRLYNYQENIITFPYFFVERKVMQTLVDNATTRDITVLCGNRVSGKSYCLASLVNKIKDRTVYYFDSSLQIGRKNVEYLLEKCGSVIIFDTNVINIEEFKYIVDHRWQLHENGIHIVIALNRSDRDNIAVIENKSFAEVINLSSKLSSTEFNEINRKIAKIPLTPLSTRGNTLLDKLIETADTSIGNQQYASSLITIKNKYTLSACILLATHEKIDDLTMIKFNLSCECMKLREEVEYQITDYYLFPFERTNSNNSSYRVICNAQYWLFAQLRKYAGSGDHDAIIVEAYQYIVSTLIKYGHKYFKEIEDFIKFDNLNLLFVSDANRSALLIRKIYEGLSDLLSQSYQYHHQYAISLLWGKSSIQNCERALDHARNALAQVETQLPNYQKHLLFSEVQSPLCISQAHIQFTLCLVYIRMCKLKKYHDLKIVENAMDALKTAVENPKNTRAFKKAKNNKELKTFINHLVTESNKSLKLYNDKINRIVNQYCKTIKN